jgi:hypothetical protein
MLVVMTAGDEEELLDRQVRWAHLYDGYQRLASPPDALFALIEPAQREFERTGRIPDWCGRGYGLAPSGSMLAEWRAVLRAIAVHPGALGEDIPPNDELPRQALRRGPHSGP